ncbi:MAG: hypothetical protein R3C46_00735 [Hyphomonadaceae bacterium]
MKRIMIFAAAAAMAASVAHANPVTVTAPQAPVSAEEAQAYVASLEKAVKQVCRKAANPVVGLGYYKYLACLKGTRAEVAKQDPTGLYAADSRSDLVVAAR